ncbi:MAG: MotA/TolQ/ExbB proton channel family protein [Planctomycetes bacterium]|nr:MotA/TolQ/ExbB proton channel family protein [Planctomycetota bacterium]
MTTHLVKVLAALPVLASGGALTAQQDPVEPSAIQQANTVLQRKYEQALQELSRVRSENADAKLELMTSLRDAESKLLAARREFQDRSRVLETRSLSLTNLEGTIKWLEEDASNVQNILGDYMRNLESRLHIVEKHRFHDVIENARLAAESANLTPAEISARQIAVLDAAIERIEDAAGGVRFQGQALDANGLITDGTFALIGPNALFLGKNGKTVGTIERRGESTEPSLTALPTPELEDAARRVVADGVGSMPVDPSLGEATQVAALQETLWEHLEKGGVVMYPMFVLAGAALLIALFKWLHLTFVRLPSQRRLNELYESVSAGDVEGARQEASAVQGPVGRMLEDGVEHMDEPRDLIEEVMFEHVLSTRLRLQSWLPFIAITAAASPLLGLLGTVTGIMNTFALMTVFGTGNAKALSSGISEALITTETGLYIAIPSLLLHAFLARKAKSVIDRMEKSAVAFMNRIGQQNIYVGDPDDDTAAPAHGDQLSMDRVREVIAEMLADNNASADRAHRTA